MTTHTKYEHGTFSWIELGTTDPGSAKKFYGGLFGWTFDDMPMGSGPDDVYTMCKMGDNVVGALFKMPAEMKGVPPHWGAYITVDDLDATTKLAAKNGGRIVKEPFDVMDVGRMAVIEDPTGATFSLWEAKAHIGATLTNEPGSLAWNELFTNNVDRAGKFYTSTLGWSTEAVDMGPMGTYTLFQKPGEKANKGGMMPIGPQMAGVPPHWLSYITTADVDASATKVTALGGKVVMPPMDIPNIGRFSIVQDPQGATFALYKNAH